MHNKNRKNGIIEKNMLSWHFKINDEKITFTSKNGYYIKHGEY